jgi:hypothetical protein
MGIVKSAQTKGLTLERKKKKKKMTLMLMMTMTTTTFKVHTYTFSKSFIAEAVADENKMNFFYVRLVYK